jgi:glyoxylase-like metal-dependent hydrolase (beta-lactamase superfamily II)
MTMPNVSLDERPDVSAFLDAQSNTTSYVIKDPGSTSCAIIDAVMQFDYATGRLSYESADEIIDFITSNGLHLEWIIGTRVHAGHLSAPPYIQGRLGGKLGLVSTSKRFRTPLERFSTKGSNFSEMARSSTSCSKMEICTKLVALSALPFTAPGHTPACMVHVMGDAAFACDTLFMPDGGSARADFPGGDACELYYSIT